MVLAISAVYCPKCNMVIENYNDLDIYERCYNYKCPRCEYRFTLEIKTYNKTNEYLRKIKEFDLFLKEIVDKNLISSSLHFQLYDALIDLKKQIETGEKFDTGYNGADLLRRKYNIGD